MQRFFRWSTPSRDSPTISYIGPRKFVKTFECPSNGNRRFALPSMRSGFDFSCFLRISDWLRLKQIHGFFIKNEYFNRVFRNTNDTNFKLENKRYNLKFWIGNCVFKRRFQYNLLNVGRENDWIMYIYV